MIEITMLELIFWGFLQAIVIAFAVSKVFPKIKVSGPIIMWKSVRGLGSVAKLAKKHQRLWRAYGDFGVILAFGLAGALYVFRTSKHKWRNSLLASLFLLSPTISNIIIGLATGQAYYSTNSLGGLGQELGFQALLLCFGFSASLFVLIAQSAIGVVTGYLAGTAVQAAVAPALPGIAVKGSPFQIPWYGWLAFPIIIFVHELSHGILTKAQGLRLKATGLLMFGIFPLGAFVEPDEKQLKKASAEKQLRVYSVGSAANYITSFAVLALFLVVVNPAISATGFYEQYSNYYDHPVIGAISPDSDANGKLAEGMKILSINGANIASIDALHNATNVAGPGALLAITTDKGSYDVRLTSDAKIGITSLKDSFLPMPLWMDAVVFIAGLISLIVFFNFIVGVMNLLPMYPLDGGLMLEALVSTKIGRKRAASVTKVITVLGLAMILVNMLPLFFQAA